MSAPDELRIQVKRLDPNLPLPSYAHPGDAGADLHTTEDVTLAPGERALVPTGIAIALPPGHVALVHPRSGLAARHGLSIVNAPGTVDEGSMLVPHLEGRDVRVQVDEASGAVRSVVMVAEEGAVEFAAFAAPRNGDLWSTLRPQIVEDVLGRGGRATEREGRWGTELMCIVPVTQPDGTQSGTFFGRPAVEPAAESEWDEALAKVVVRRGSAAMPAGEPLPLTLPENARRTN